MSWDAVTLLRTQSKKIYKTIQSIVIEQYPNRTKEFKKCSRDIKFIIQAISTCIQSNDTIAIDHIVKIFYLGDALQLSSIEVELEIYTLLEQQILQIFDANNVDDQSKKIVSNCIEILKIGLQEGPTVINSKWADRRNFKVYDSSVVVPIAMQEHIETILQNAPMQTSGKSRFSILKLLPNDLEIKEFLATHYFMNSSLDRHEIAIVTAPIIYLCIAHTDDNLSQLNEETVLTKQFHIGIHGGATLDYVLSQGYDFSFIGCTDDPTDKITKKWTKMILERFNYVPNQYCAWPFIAFCIGKGVEKFDHQVQHYTTLAGDVLAYHYTGEKLLQRKPNIIYY